MQALPRVLIVDGDAARRRSLAEQLELHGEFAGTECGSAAAALAAARCGGVDAVLLDGDLPDMESGVLCGRLRSAGLAVPVVVLTAPDQSVAAIDAGAAMLPRPIRLSTLLALLRDLLRPRETGDALTIGPYAFQPGAKLLRDRAGQKEVRLTEKETAILEFLYRAGKTIGRDTLLGEVWGYNAGVTTHTLETHVYRLRRKIERDPANAELLVTEPGGYRLLP